MKNNSIEYNEEDPFRWTRYHKMMEDREGIDFNNKNNCKRCGKPRGNHVTASVLKRNPNCCPFVKF